MPCRIGKSFSTCVAKASLVSYPHLVSSVVFSMLNCLGFELIYENHLREFQESMFFLSREVQTLKTTVPLWTLKKKSAFKLNAEQLFLCSRQFVLFLSWGNQFGLNGKRAASDNFLPLEDPHCLSGQFVDNDRPSKSTKSTKTNDLHFLHPILRKYNFFQLFL